MNENFEFKRLTDFFEVEVHEVDIFQSSLDKFLLCCPYCGGIRVISRGWRRNKRKGKVRRYYCKDCHRKFTNNNFPGHLPLKIIADILRWTVEGRSPVNIANDVKEKYGSEYGVSSQTIVNVVRRWVKIFLKFESTRKHKLESQEWQIDDTPQIFPKNEKAIKKLEGENGKFVWITNVLAVSSRYWLSAIVSNDRTADESYKAVRMAVQRAKYVPFKIRCDAYKGHRAGIRKAYHFIEIDWKSKREDFSCINLIESLHSFIRRKGVKKRGRFRSIENLQAFIELLRIYYNFLHSHGALGTTPAAKAGVTPQFNSWSEFIHYVYWHLK